MLSSYDNTVKLKLNKVFYLDYSFRYTAPTALNIRQEVKQIMANVFLFNVFKSFKIFLHVLNVF